MKKLLQSPISRKFVFAILALVAVSVAFVGCRKEPEPKQVLNKVKEIKAYFDGSANNQLISSTFYTYDNQDRLVNIKTVRTPNAPPDVANQEESIVYNDKGQMQEYYEKYEYGSGNINEVMWKATSTNNVGQVLTATYTTYTNATLNTSRIQTYAYTNGLLTLLKFSNLTKNYRYTYHANGQLKTLIMDNDTWAGTSYNYDSNGNLTTINGFLIAYTYEYNSKNMPNWFLFKGNAHYVSGSVSLNDSNMQKNLRTGTSVGSSATPELFWSYEYDENERPKSRKMVGVYYNTREEITYLD